MCKQRSETSRHRLSREKLSTSDDVKGFAIGSFLERIVVERAKLMMTSVRKTLKTLVWLVQNRSVSSKICPENNHKICCFFIDCFPAKFAPTILAKSCKIGRFFRDFVPKNPAKFDFFFHDLSEGLYGVRRKLDVWVAHTLPLPPLLWVWESTARRWRLWDAADSSCDDTADAADLRRLWLWQSWLSLEDEAVDSEDFFPIPRLSAMLSKPSSERYFLPLKSSLMKNSFDGRLDLVLLCPWPSLIQYPLTRCRIMLAQAFSKSCWSRTFSSSWLCSPSSWWWPSSSNSLKMSSAEKHWKYKEEY